MGILNAVRKEVLGQVNLILPMCFTFLLRKSIDIVSVIFVGQFLIQITYNYFLILHPICRSSWL